MGTVVAGADVGRMRDGEAIVVPAGSEEVALFRVQGAFYACANACPHRGGPLGEGTLEGKIVTCPWHGWEFDVTTGKNPVNAGLSVTTYPVTVRDGTVEIGI